MIKNLIYIKTVSFRAGRHAQPEIRPEIVHNLPVAFRAGMMGLIQADNCELLRRKGFPHGIPTHHLHSSKNKIRLADGFQFPGRAAGKQGVTPGRTVVLPGAKDFLITGQCLPGNLLPVHQKQHFFRMHVPERKGGGIGFTGSGGRNQQRPSGSLPHQLANISHEGRLHGIGLQTVLLQRHRYSLPGNLLLFLHQRISDPVILNKLLIRQAVGILPKRTEFLKNVSHHFSGFQSHQLGVPLPVHLQSTGSHVGTADDDPVNLFLPKNISLGMKSILIPMGHKHLQFNIFQRMQLVQGCRIIKRQIIRGENLPRNPPAL